MFDQNLNTCNKSCEIKAKHFYVNIAQIIELFTIIYWKKSYLTLHQMILDKINCFSVCMGDFIIRKKDQNQNFRNITSVTFFFFLPSVLHCITRINYYYEGVTFFFISILIFKLDINKIRPSVRICVK